MSSNFILKKGVYYSEDLVENNECVKCASIGFTTNSFIIGLHCYLLSALKLDQFVVFHATKLKIKFKSNLYFLQFFS